MGNLEVQIFSSTISRALISLQKKIKSNRLQDVKTTDRGNLQKLSAAKVLAATIKKKET